MKYINVFITKTLKFRVRYVNKLIHEVTIGGKNWMSGKGNHVKNEAKELTEKMISSLLYEFAKSFVETKTFSLKHLNKKFEIKIGD